MATFIDGNKKLRICKVKQWRDHIRPAFEKKLS